jgi:hypothetical protein
MKIRLCGLALLVLCGLGFVALTHLAALPAGARSTWLELAVGAACVLAEMAGMPMLLLGRKLSEPVPVPQRSWHSVSGYVDDY